MGTQQVGFSLRADQRYYHFIIFRLLENYDYSLADYWKQFQKDIVPDTYSEITHEGFEVQHQQIKSKIPYARGRIVEQISAKGNGMPPYYYDIFAIRRKVGHNTYVAFAFPFIALGRDIIDRLISKHNLMKHADILKVDLPPFIRQRGETEKPESPENLSEPIRTNIVGLRATIADDPALSLITLDGDNPLESVIYQAFLKEEIDNGGVVLDNCVQLYELQWPLRRSNEPTASQRRLRTRIHMNKFGYFKFYMHIGGENCCVIPYMLERVDTLGYLSATSINPFRRVHEEVE